MKSLKSLFQQLLSKEQRKAERHPSPRLAAYYWNGGSPIEHPIRDISSAGLFLITEERWYPGTLLLVTLQKKDSQSDDSERSISVQSKAVRWGSDGVGLEFIAPDLGVSRPGQNTLAGGVDRKSLERFLQGLREDNASAVIDRVTHPSDSSSDASTTKP